MSNNTEPLDIRVTTAPNQVTAIKAIREVTNLSIAEIKTAIVDSAPLTIVKLYGIDHDEMEQIVNRLFEQLDNAGVVFEIILNGNVESRQYFLNAMEQWREIRLYFEMTADS